MWSSTLSSGRSSKAGVLSMSELLASPQYLTQGAHQAISQSTLTRDPESLAGCDANGSTHCLSHFLVLGRSRLFFLHILHQCEASPGSRDSASCFGCMRTCQVGCPSTCTA